MPTMPNDRLSALSGGATLLTASGAHALRVRRADDFLSRFCGLMLRAPLAPDAGLLLADCPSVHTAFMRCSIDVVYLDAHGVVLKCVPRLRPWWGSFSDAGCDANGARHRRAAHTLEMVAGSIARLNIVAGSRLGHPLWFASSAPSVPNAPPATSARPAVGARHRQRGAALVELAVVAPILTIMGLSTAQYSSLYFTKNQINHATFLAARAGSVGNADLAKIKTEYARALVPLYGGGETAEELAASYKRAVGAVYGDGSDPGVAYIEMLNPTKEAFDDFNDPRLQKLLKTNDKRVISNRGLGLTDDKVGPTSGETRDDANLLKLRILQGVKPAVPVVGSIYTAYLKWMDSGLDANRSALIQRGLIPVVSHVTVQMQSDAIEPDHPVSSPGNGNGGDPVDPGEPPPPDNGPEPGDCNVGCDLPPSDGDGSTGECKPEVKADISADTLFNFDQATLTTMGQISLQKLIESTKGSSFDKMVITGYTDPIGNKTYNDDLSRRRAQAVANYLAQNGLQVPDVQVVGAGSTNPVVNPADCAGKTGTDQQLCFARDRRVTIVLTPHN